MTTIVDPQPATDLGEKRPRDETSAVEQPGSAKRLKSAPTEQSDSPADQAAGAVMDVDPATNGASTDAPKENAENQDPKPDQEAPKPDQEAPKPDQDAPKPEDASTKPTTEAPKEDTGASTQDNPQELPTNGTENTDPASKAADQIPTATPDATKAADQIPTATPDATPASEIPLTEPAPAATGQSTVTKQTECPTDATHPETAVAEHTPATSEFPLAAEPAGDVGEGAKDDSKMEHEQAEHVPDDVQTLAAAVDPTLAAQMQMEAAEQEEFAEECPVEMGPDVVYNDKDGVEWREIVHRDGTLGNIWLNLAKNVYIDYHPSEEHLPAGEAGEEEEYVAGEEGDAEEPAMIVPEMEDTDEYEGDYEDEQEVCLDKDKIKELFSSLGNNAAEEEKVSAESPADGETKESDQAPKADEKAPEDPQPEQMETDEQAPKEPQQQQMDTDEQAPKESCEEAQKNSSVEQAAAEPSSAQDAEKETSESKEEPAPKPEEPAPKPNEEHVDKPAGGTELVNESPKDEVKEPKEAPQDKSEEKQETSKASGDAATAKTTSEMEVDEVKSSTEVSQPAS